MKWPITLGQLDPIVDSRSDRGMQCYERPARLSVGLPVRMSVNEAMIQSLDGAPSFT